jgi:hypothetical protein
MVEKGEKGLTDSLTGALLQGDTRASSVPGLAGPAVLKKCPVTVDAGGEVCWEVSVNVGTARYG